LIKKMLQRFKRKVESKMTHKKLVYIMSCFDGVGLMKCIYKTLFSSRHQLTTMKHQIVVVPYQGKL
tara:strand:+ start:313 stop:510 length:198 start_codon:yes stop_codon:yes gene_type:complete